MNQKRITLDRAHGSFLHSFLSSNMPSLRPLAFISCHITSIHVFFGLPCALLTCPKLIRSTRRTGVSVGLRRTWPSHRKRFSFIFSFIEATLILTCPSQTSMYLNQHPQQWIKTTRWNSVGGQFFIWKLQTLSGWNSLYIHLEHGHLHSWPLWCEYLSYNQIDVSVFFSSRCQGKSPIKPTISSQQ